MPSRQLTLPLPHVVCAWPVASQGDVFVIATYALAQATAGQPHKQTDAARLSQFNHT